MIRFQERRQENVFLHSPEAHNGEFFQSWEMCTIAKSLIGEHTIHRLSPESFSTFISADYKVLSFMLTKD
jgi:hypothetical protein